MKQITEITGTGLPLLLDDIDTDRIIPARFLRCVTFDGLGEHAFEDDRQQDHTHPFDDAHYLGVPCVCASRADLEKLAALAKAEPECPVTVDLTKHEVRAGHLTVPVTILDSARIALTTGKWDFLGQLLEGADAVRKAATTLPYMNGFKA